MKSHQMVIGLFVLLTAIIGIAIGSEIRNGANPLYPDTPETQSAFLRITRPKKRSSTSNRVIRGRQPYKVLAAERGATS